MRRPSYNRRRNAKLRTLDGYDPACNHQNIMLADLNLCDCGQPVSHLVYVAIGAGYRQALEPLPLCDACHVLHLSEERRDVGTWFVPSRTQTAHISGRIV